MAFTSATNRGWYYATPEITASTLGSIRLRIGSSGVQFNNNAYLIGEAAHTLAQRSGTNAQTFNIYNTFTTASTNYNAFSINATATGTDL